jgi:hypothetical protein
MSTTTILNSDTTTVGGTLKVNMITSTSTLYINERTNYETAINSATTVAQNLTFGTPGFTTQYIRGVTVYINEFGSGNTVIGTSGGVGTLTVNASGIKTNTITSTAPSETLKIGGSQTTGNIQIGYPPTFTGNIGIGTIMGGGSIDIGSYPTGNNQIVIGDGTKSTTYLRGNTVYISDGGTNVNIGNSGSTTTVAGTLSIKNPISLKTDSGSPYTIQGKSEYIVSTSPFLNLFNGTQTCYAPSEKLTVGGNYIMRVFFYANSANYTSFLTKIKASGSPIVNGQTTGVFDNYDYNFFHADGNPSTGKVFSYTEVGILTCVAGSEYISPTISMGGGTGFTPEGTACNTGYVQMFITRIS